VDRLARNAADTAANKNVAWSYLPHQEFRNNTGSAPWYRGAAAAEQRFSYCDHRA
jgi:hypothetical protein